MRKVIGVLVAAGLIGCAPIERQETLIEGSATAATTGVGGVVAKIEKTRNLKNIYGGADIWGRKTKEGFAEIRFAGVEQDGTIVLFRRDLVIETDEDTLTRSGFGMATTNAYGSATVTGNSVSGSANSTTLSMQPRDATTIAVPTGTFPIRVPAGTTKVPFEGKIIEIISADSVSLTYRVIG